MICYHVCQTKFNMWLYSTCLSAAIWYAADKKPFLLKTSSSWRKWLFYRVILASRNKSNGLISLSFSFTQFLWLIALWLAWSGTMSARTVELLRWCKLNGRVCCWLAWFWMKSYSGSWENWAISVDLYIYLWEMLIVIYPWGEYCGHTFDLRTFEWTSSLTDSFAFESQGRV